ncbi:MAG: ferrous iron transport protein B [Clostridia bacterium]|nr:ferrous iron transport protein B [Clostridia bacterium]
MEKKQIRIALAGNPNSGKTTLFNALTGSSQYVGNWPGVTVEKKEGRLRRHPDVVVTDLPGIYSLSPYTPEEIVARRYLVGERPDAILNIVDGTNLERNLYLTTQLTELGIPVVIVINMMDVVRKRRDEIDTLRLSRALGCPIFEASALKNDGVFEAAEAAIEAARGGASLPCHNFRGVVEHALAHIEEAAVHHLPLERQRWYAIKLFERDERVLGELALSPEVLSHLEGDIRCAERECDDDSESIITNERYDYIASVLKDCYKKRSTIERTVSDKIDRIVTNRFAAIPIFAAIMFLVYYVSVSTLGTMATDWTNDVLFGKWILPSLSTALDAIGCWPWLRSLIVDGIVGGVGAVLGFVPQMLILFAMLGFLEASGYMSRVAFVLDRVFRRLGLSGKSFIPMLVGVGCSVPGIMASRTIESERDRRMTVMTTSFIPCGAKLPLIGLVAGVAFGGESALVSTAAYLIGVAAVLFSGLILKKTKRFEGDPAPFIMELPSYHLPTAKNLLLTTWERGWSFIKKAGTVILLSTVVLWFLQSFGFEGGFGWVDDASHSLLALIGRPLALLFIPLGFGFWQAAVASLTGLLAKENVVATFGVLYGAAEVAENGAEIWGALAGDFGSSAAALSFLVFNLLCAPCFAAMGAIRREMNSASWTAFAIGYQCLLAYATSLVVYQLGTLMTSGFALVHLPALIGAVAVLGVAVWLLVRRPEHKKG